MTVLRQSCKAKRKKQRWVISTMTNVRTKNKNLIQIVSLNSSRLSLVQQVKWLIILVRKEIGIYSLFVRRETFQLHNN